MISVVNSAVNKAYDGNRKINWQEVLAGQKAFDAVGEWLPEETKELHVSRTHINQGSTYNSVEGGLGA